ncbi:MAG: hypothetical protein IJI80_04440 [Methanobrevibacter sp.]|uniref:hypothetical protein n=1 Tax=Methanobrevibacter sp. TaxID=66852 RepID=UPI0025EE0889|nr:hypothetical protein [Methanobrevibacter sp.]MBQ6098994.1 hypothetical protein [Methanobrevibacter sp.]MBQ6138907.1 hypothetical protein [Methanobrevibacter sp.]
MKDVPGTENINWCKEDRNYRISKRINGTQKLIGSSKSLISALMIRDWSKANNWKRYPKRDTKSHEHYIRVNDKADPLYRYRVAKVINGKEYSFGSFPLLEEAIQCRDNCIKNNWSLDLIPVDPLRYIEFIIRGGKIKYNIKHKENGSSVNYGLFNTIHEAMHERDLLEQCNWDFEVICNLDERINEETIYLSKVMV